MNPDPLILSRIQFGFVVSFHILFPAFTIGLASWLAMLEGLFLATGREAYRRLYEFWMKIFAVSFGMGVVSGIVMSFQFGTNWSELSLTAGNIFGPLLSYEVVTAFFLEATFLGIMLFGWNKVSRGFHFFSTVMVAVGTLISTFWIISANSWLHTPAGYVIENGVFVPDDWWAIVFNPSFPYRLVHMVLAAYLTTCFVIGGISAFYLWRGRPIEEARIMFSMAVGFATVVAPLQIIAGDFQGLNVLEHQPAKVAAMEGSWESREGAPLVLFALPDAEAETNHYEIAIPHLSSLILTHDWNGRVPGLKDFPREERPPVWPVFWSFRIMVAIGFAMLFAGITGLVLRWRGRLYDTRWFQWLSMAMTPAGFIAVLCGWFTAEIGRQPYVVYGLLRTEDALSPVSGFDVAVSLALFLVVYTFVFGAGTYYLLKLIHKGPASGEPGDTDTVYKKPKRPLSFPDERMEVSG